MTQTLEQANAVCQAWRQSGRIGIVDMQIRYASVTRAVRELLDAGAVGTVRNVICMDYVGRSGCFFRAQRSRRHDQIVSLTLAKGVHFLDLCNYFMGDEPVRAFATASTQVFGGKAPNDLRCRDCDQRDTCQWDGAKGTIHGEAYPFRDSLCVYAEEVDIPDNTSAVIDYRRGGRASYFECYYTPEYETVFDIIGEKGALKLRYGMDNHLWLELRDRPSRTITHRDFFAHGAHGGGDTALVDATLAAVRGKQQIPPTIADGRHAVALCCAIDESARTGLPATIPPLPASCLANDGMTDRRMSGSSPTQTTAHSTTPLPLDAVNAARSVVNPPSAPP